MLILSTVGTGSQQQSNCTSGRIFSHNSIGKYCEFKANNTDLQMILFVFFKNSIIYILRYCFISACLEKNNSVISLETSDVSLSECTQDITPKTENKWLGQLLAVEDYIFYHTSVIFLENVQNFCLFCFWSKNLYRSRDFT